MIYIDNGSTIAARRRDALKGNSRLVASIEGTASIVTTRGKKLTLHRISLNPNQPPTFYITYDERPASPILANANERYLYPYAVFTIEGDVISRDHLIRLVAEDGSSEVHIIDQLTVRPRPHLLPVFMRDGKDHASSC